MTKMFELPDEIVQEIERRAALEGKNVVDTAAAIFRKGLGTLESVKTPHPVADAAMLARRKEILDKFLTGEWGIDFGDYEATRAKEREEAKEQMQKWSE